MQKPLSIDIKIGLCILCLSAWVLPGCKYLQLALIPSPVNFQYTDNDCSNDEWVNDSCENECVNATANCMNDCSYATHYMHQFVNDTNGQFDGTIQVNGE